MSDFIYIGYIERSAHGDSPRVEKIPVLKRTAKQLVVKNCRATGWRNRVSTMFGYPTYEEALADLIDGRQASVEAAEQKLRLARESLAAAELLPKSEPDA